MSIVNIYAPNHIDPFDSYGLIACELAEHLEKMGAYVNLLALGERHSLGHSAETKAITQHPITAAFGGLFLGYPTSYEKHDNPLASMGRRVAVTMFESSIVPDGWVEALNKMNAVIVPSTFCRDVFTDCGVNVPMHVIPLGISETFKPYWRPHYPQRPYTFLAIGDRGRRKNVDAALQAFLLAFDGDMNHRLVIKTRDNKKRSGITFTNPNIDVISQDLTEDELYRLYCDCDCMIFPSRAEGFGLPPREFAATGAPAIATNWSGLADDIDTWGIPLEYKLATADWQGSRNLEGQDLGQWAEPEIEHLADLMKCISQHKQAYRIRAHQAASEIHGLYSWQSFAKGVYNVWRQN
jgi:glycosyltransferase involved in cell wall biosynthesis